jgi:UDP-2,3-diacylglucosamine pyrophosphatase LpxH
MKFLHKTNEVQKKIIVISDLHLSAGKYFKGKLNPLEDFHSGKELIDFLEYYSTGEFKSVDLELIINGDFLDFLAVPFVDYFDDEYWSEKAGLEKLKIIYDAHREVFNKLNEFLSRKNKKITYIIGNHDAEMILPSLKDYFIDIFDQENRFKLKILSEVECYKPLPGILIQHGHEFEIANNYDPKTSIVQNTNGENYFVPPWGSYYILRVLNKFKIEKKYINYVKPIKYFFIVGFLFDTLFTLRFFLANLYYFIMVRFLQLFKEEKSIFDSIKNSFKELELFKDSQDLTKEYLEKNSKVKALITGHTHLPAITLNSNKQYFINTGTWIKTIHLDFGRLQEIKKLTYAEVDLYKNKKWDEDYHVNLSVWSGVRDKPYNSFEY